MTTEAQLWQLLKAQFKNDTRFKFNRIENSLASGTADVTFAVNFLENLDAQPLRFTGWIELKTVKLYTESLVSLAALELSINQIDFLNAHPNSYVLVQPTNFKSHPILLSFRKIKMAVEQRTTWRQLLNTILRADLADELKQPNGLYNYLRGALLE